MGKNRATHKADGRGKEYALLPHVALDALLANCSPRAVAVALAILRRFNGFNNDKIGLSMRDLGRAIGSHNNPANKRALAELETAGFIRIRRYPKGQRKANEYGLAFISTGQRGEHPATHDYLERLETKKSLGWKLDTRTGFRVSETNTRGKHRESEIDTGKTETSGFRDPSPVLETDTHIVSHGRDSFRLAGNTRSNIDKMTGGTFAAMELCELRELCLQFLNWAPSGAQSQLAHAATIPGGTLSKFLRGRSLPESYRLPLQLAVGRSFPMEARNAA